MSRDTMQIPPVQGERERMIIVEGELEYFTALIDDLADEWCVDENRAVILLPRFPSERRDKLHPWWYIRKRDVQASIKLMGTLVVRGLPRTRTRVTFRLFGFPAPDVFWETADEIIEEMKERGFIELQPSHTKDEGGKECIFISYRRDDSAGHAGRLYDRLSERFGEGQIFMDVATIESGLDFPRVVEEAASSCDVLIAIIGKQWLTITDAATGRRRLDDPEDLVRLEIATALVRNIQVIPVLVGGATMPPKTNLPDTLKKLSHRNALEISDTRFDYDVGRLIERLQKLLGMPDPPLPHQRLR